MFLKFSSFNVNIICITLNTTPTSQNKFTAPKNFFSISPAPKTTEFRPETEPTLLYLPNSGVLNYCFARSLVNQ